MFLRWFDSGSDASEEGGGGAACSATLALTVLATACTTALLVAAVVTDHWEHVAWDRARVEQAVNTTPHHAWRLDWFLDGQVARLLRGRPIARRSDSGGSSSGSSSNAVAVLAVAEPPPTTTPTLFLLPMNGGIWTLCASVSDDERAALRAAGLAQPSCVNYLSASRNQDARPDTRPSWQRRMQNLSISCALVCLIILGSSAVVGAFGVAMHQASAVLVTGVLYFLAGTFALFTLTIIHFKRNQSPAALALGGRRGGGGGGNAIAALTVDGVLAGGAVGPAPVLPPPPLWGPLLAARRVDTAWSLQLGWGGVAGALLSAALWLALARAMRGPPPPP